MKPFSILIAEDESIVMLDLRNLLKKSGYNNTLAVQDGDTLISTALVELPSLIISDVFLKGNTDGIAAANRIWEKQEIPFIFISGLEIDKSKIDLSKCEIVKKPFDEYDLISAVKKLTSSPFSSHI